MKHTFFPDASICQMPDFDLQASEPQRKRVKSPPEDSTAGALLSLASFLSNKGPEKGNLAIASYDDEKYHKANMRALSSKDVPSPEQSYKRPIGSKGSPSSKKTYKSYVMKTSSQRPLGNWMDAYHPLPSPPRLPSVPKGYKVDC